MPKRERAHRVAGHDWLILDESTRIERQWKTMIIVWILRTQKSCITLAERIPDHFVTRLLGDWVLFSRAGSCFDETIE